jgi:hypothetical protein
MNANTVKVLSDAEGIVQIKLAPKLVCTLSYNSLQVIAFVLLYS